MLQPKRRKHRKAQRGNMNVHTKRGATLAFGTFGLKALDEVWMSSRQIESARQAMTRHMKREGNVWIRIFPDKPITAKPAEVRMGKGKGAVYTKFCYIKPGQVIFEFSGISLYQIKLLHNFLRNKCPFKVKIINI